MCAELHLNGEGIAKNEYVSLYFCIMPGTYDGIQTWPFMNHQLKMSVINQSNMKGEKEHVIIPDVVKNPTCYTQPTASRNLGIGLRNFLSHTLLTPDGPYVRNDTMFIRLEVLKSKK